MMIRMWVLAAATIVGAAAAGEAADRADGFAAEFAGPIEKAHGAEAWESHEAVRFDFAMTKPDGSPRLKATIIFETGPERVRMELADGTVAVWDGRDAWVAPADSDFAAGKPRFHLRTWTYFLASPFKLRDPGSTLSALPDAPLMEGASAKLERAKLTFGKGVGDSPEDWYIAYREPKRGRLKGLAYIVTYGGADPDQAAENAHAVVYEAFETVEGVTLPTKWTFRNYSEEAAVHGPLLFKVDVSNIEFVTPDPDAFEKPDGAKRVPLPEE